MSFFNKKIERQIKMIKEIINNLSYCFPNYCILQKGDSLIA